MRTVFFAFFTFFICVGVLSQKSINWDDLKINQQEKYVTKFGVERIVPSLTESQKGLVDNPIKIKGYVVGLLAGPKTCYALSNKEGLNQDAESEQILLDLNFLKQEDLEKVKKLTEIEVEGVLIFNQRSITGSYFYLENVKILE